jgi:hypothetical protein
MDDLLQVFVAFIEWRGILQTPQESLRQALARALEVSCSELDEQLRDGVNPIRKFLAERGLLDEMEGLPVG